MSLVCFRSFCHTFVMADADDLRVPCRNALLNARLLLPVVCLAGVLSGTACGAQDGPAQDEPIHTLHVYTNLMQIPTLVLAPNRERLEEPIAERRFSVSIDSGPWFPATHVRREGDDPISLSILLEVNGHSSEWMPKIADAISGLAPLSLQARDHVSIYVLDCSFRQILEDAPPVKEDLKRAVDSALQMWSDRRQKKPESDCKPSSRIWDALTSIILDPVYHLPGRRVVLAITDGNDKGSTSSWEYVRVIAQSAGVAIFGLTYKQSGPRPLAQRYEDAFNQVCQLSGGMVRMTDGIFLGPELKRFTEMLRERYVVEVPRPAHSTSGEHGFAVKVAKGDDYFIRPTGITVPLPDVAVLADPTTVPSDPSLTPEMGTRAPMKKPQ